MKINGKTIIVNGKGKIMASNRDGYQFWIDLSEGVFHSSDMLF